MVKRENSCWTAGFDCITDPKLFFPCFFVVVIQGDSGGPLLYNGVVVGITSNGGKKCGQTRKPGIYTIISHYTQWIDNIMNPQPAAAEDQSA